VARVRTAPSTASDVMALKQKYSRHLDLLQASGSGPTPKRDSDLLEDMAEGGDGQASKKAKTDMGIPPPYVGVSVLNYAGSIPLSLNMNEKRRDPKSKKGKKGKNDTDADSNSESRDEGNNILVTTVFFVPLQSDRQASRK